MVASRLVRTVLTVCLLGMVSGCGQSPPGSGELPAGSGDGRPQVFAVNYPLQYFAERIAGEEVDVRFPAPADEDPAYWIPSPEVVVEYQQADLILLNGAGYAGWTSRVSLPKSRMVDTSEAFREQYIEIEHAALHRHGPKGEHSHGQKAFTTWLDPRQAAVGAEAIRDALVKLCPQQAEAIEKRHEALAADLQKLDAILQEVLAPLAEQPLLASHPVYQYLVRRYGLNLKSVHWEPNEMPDDDQWSRLAALLREHPARWMLWEAPPQPSIAEKLRQHGVSSVVFYPCGNVPAEGDYLQLMRENAGRLQDASLDRQIFGPDDSRAR